MELEHLRGGSATQHADGNWYIDNLKGKGGKIRSVPILNNDPDIINKISNTPSSDLVWGPVHSAADIHGYRADYAKALYNQNERDLDQLKFSEKYYCKNDMAGTSFDRQAMQIVSNALGHNRIGIIAQNYLY